MSGCRSTARFLALLAWLPGPATARPLPEEPRLDFAGGPILGSTRITAMGGAHLGIAEGAHGFALTPAAAANPFAYNHDANFDYDVILELNTFLRHDVDFNNDGQLDPSFDKLTIINLGGTFHDGGWGMGLTSQSYSYQVSVETDDARARTKLDVSTVHLGFGDATDAGQLIVGVALRIGSVDLTTERSERFGEGFDPVGKSEERFSGGALELGLLYRPRGQPWRLGAAFRSPVISNRASKKGIEASGFVSPARGESPAELAVGVAVRLGEGELNRPLPLREKRPPPADHRYVLLAADLVLTGRVKGGQSVEAFLRQRAQASGRGPSLTPRLGVEAEVWEDVLRLRAGHYLEPARVEGSTVRPHLTAGTELWVAYIDLIDSTLAWSTMIDWAPRYLSFSVLSLGFWH